MRATLRASGELPSRPDLCCGVKCSDDLSMLELHDGGRVLHFASIVRVIACTRCTEQMPRACALARIQHVFHPSVLFQNVPSALSLGPTGMLGPPRSGDVRRRRTGHHRHHHHHHHHHRPRPRDRS
eukprot:4494370-Pleurochrysis_carterae.AAC.1